MFGMLEISTSALTAYRTSLDVIAGNVAMRDAVRFENGEAVPYRRRVPLFAMGNPSNGPNAPGVHVSAIVEDSSPFGLEWDPGNVHAIQQGPQKGYVRTSNVNYNTEMVNAMMAARAYEANVTVMEATKAMARTTMRLLA